MNTYLIMSRTMSQAQRLANFLSRSGYYATVVRPPAAVTLGDCVYAVKVPERQFANILSLINQSGFERGKIYLYRSDGSTAEINI